MLKFVPVRGIRTSSMIFSGVWLRLWSLSSILILLGIIFRSRPRITDITCRCFRTVYCSVEHCPSSSFQSNYLLTIASWMALFHSAKLVSNSSSTYTVVIILTECMILDCVLAVRSSICWYVVVILLFLLLRYATIHSILLWFLGSSDAVSCVFCGGILLSLRW